MSQVVLSKVDTVDNRWSFYSIDYSGLGAPLNWTDKSLANENIPTASQYLATSTSDDKPRKHTEARSRRLTARNNVQIVKLPTSEQDTVSPNEVNPTRWRVNKAGVGVKFI